MSRSASLLTLTTLISCALFSLCSTIYADTLYVGEYFSRRILSYDLNGTPHGVFTQVPYVDSPNDRAQRLAFDASHNLYVSNGERSVNRISPTGIYQGVFATLPSSPAPDADGLAFDSIGNLYVAGSRGDVIYKYDANGALIQTLHTPTNARPVGLAVDHSNILYATYFNSNTIHRFLPDGTDLGDFAITGLKQANNVAFDSLGNVYALNLGSNDVHKFSSIGADLGIFVAGLNGPGGIAFDSADNLYVSLYGNEVGTTILKFSSTGQALGNFATDLTAPSSIAIISTASATPEPGAFLFLGAFLITGATCQKRLRNRTRPTKSVE
jgi:sugar lactone lactonase YvrE